MDVIHNPNVVPNMSAIRATMSQAAQERWCSLTAHIEETYKSEPLIVYSMCSGQSGWNVKYKKGSKALCTLYPEPDSFIALVVLGQADLVKLDAVRPAYTPYVLELADGARLFNNTKWLMLRVTDDVVLDDVQKLLRLKLAN